MLHVLPVAHMKHAGQRLVGLRGYEIIGLEVMGVMRAMVRFAGNLRMEFCTYWFDSPQRQHFV